MILPPSADNPGVEPEEKAPPKDRGIVTLVLLVIVALLFALGMFITIGRSQTDPHSHRGHMGKGHELWHGPFYQGLMRPDTKTSCCNLYDCRPTQSRTMGAHYQVLLDGEWIDVPPRVIVRVSAPDGGAHVCAPEQKGANKGVLYCVVLPSEG